MTTLTLEIPEPLARKLANVEPTKVVEALEIGLEWQAELDIQPTNHPYITRVSGVLSGRPVIRGTRIPVWQVVNAIVRLGDTVEDYVSEHPRLTAAQIHDALSYYFDNREAIEKEIEENQRENVLSAFNATMDERGVVHFSS